MRTVDFRPKHIPSVLRAGDLEVPPAAGDAIPPSVAKNAVSPLFAGDIPIDPLLCAPPSPAPSLPSARMDTVGTADSEVPSQLAGPVAPDGAQYLFLPTHDPEAPGCLPPAYSDEATPEISQDPATDSESEEEGKRKNPRASAAKPIYDHIQGCYEGNRPWS